MPYRCDCENGFEQVFLADGEGRDGDAAIREHPEIDSPVHASLRSGWKREQDGHSATHEWPCRRADFSDSIPNRGDGASCKIEPESLSARHSVQTAGKAVLEPESSTERYP